MFAVTFIFVALRPRNRKINVCHKVGFKIQDKIRDYVGQKTYVRTYHICYS